MESVTSFVLSAVLMLSMASMSHSETTVPVSPAAPATVQTVQTSANTSTVTGTAKVTARIYSTPISGSRVIGLLQKGTEVEILRDITVSGKNWVSIYVPSSNVTGCVLADQLEIKKEPQIEVYYQGNTANARKAIVIVDGLNYRVGPGVNKERLGSYRYGSRVSIYEVYGEWGRTDLGWVFMEYVYQEGDIGEEPMIGVVTATQLQVRVGPGVGYASIGRLNKDSRVQVLAQIPIGADNWGYTRDGWICMTYVSQVERPALVPGEYGYGFVNTNGLNVRTGPSTDFPSVDKLKLYELVDILELVEYDGDVWGRISSGWVCMAYVSMIEIYDEPEEPEEPTEPTEPEETTPEETTPEETVPDETVPEETVPEETTPEETVPEEDVTATDPTEAEGEDGDSKTE